jgi:hypothetical protein
MGWQRLEKPSGNRRTLVAVEGFTNLTRISTTERSSLLPQLKHEFAMGGHVHAQSKPAPPDSG